MKQKELGLELDFIIDAGKHRDCNYQLKKGEIWLGNSSRGIPKDLKHLKTVRLGEQAYDINGKPINRNKCRPLIIHKSEEKAYNQVHENRMKRASRSNL